MAKRKTKQKKRQRQALYSTQDLMDRWEVDYETIFDWVARRVIPEPRLHAGRRFWLPALIHGLGEAPAKASHCVKQRSWDDMSTGQRYQARRKAI